MMCVCVNGCKTQCIERVCVSKLAVPQQVVCKLSQRLCSFTSVDPGKYFVSTDNAG
jgi:hypothetical protein